MYICFKIYSGSIEFDTVEAIKSLENLGGGSSTKLGIINQVYL